jgi:hypothetical protein
VRRVSQPSKRDGGVSYAWIANTRVSLPTVLVIVAVVGAGAFAAGQSMSSLSSPPLSLVTTPMGMPQSEEMSEGNELQQSERPSMMGAGAPPAGELPAGHPPIGPMDPARAQMEPPGSPATAAEPPLEWKAPARWQLVPSASTMRLATYRVPHAPGDAVDAELSIMQAGGTVEANADRWIGQFDASGQKGARRSTRKVGPLEITIVDVQGTYSGGMSKDSSAASGWALRGAIVSMPDMPCFFKLTGPAKTVSAASAEFDALVASLAPR